MNYLSAQQSFGPMFREPGKEVPRVSNVADDLYEVEMKNYPTQSFKEESLKRNGFLLYTDTSINWLTKDDEKALFKQYTNLEQEISKLTTEISKPTADIAAIATKIAELETLRKDISEHLKKIENGNFKTALSSVYVSYTPEILFAKTLFLNIDLIDAFIKSADKGFYYFPYRYKPETIGKTHFKNENFNPDFFLKVKGTNDIIVIETKKAGDDSPKNKAKHKQAKEHFSLLNNRLEADKKNERYYFKFLSDDGSDIAAFFKSIKDNNYKIWKSTLMNQLE